jgi:uroporphyrinogen III methyltransferase/synthase
VREAIKSGVRRGVFTSSSTVRNLVGIAGKPHPSTVVACIGPATAKTAEEHGCGSTSSRRSRRSSLVDAPGRLRRGLRLAARRPASRSAAQPSARAAAPQTPS